MDRVPRELTGRQREAPEALGRQVMLLLELRRSAAALARGNEALNREVAVRKRAEEELRRSEEYRDLFRLANDSILVFDPETEIVLDVNDKACEVYGIPREEFVGRTLKALAQTARWQAAGLPELALSVNLSPRQFKQPDLIDRVGGLLAEASFDPASLELELTEGTVMEDTESAVGTLRELKGMGVKLSVDDFGSGYSSLSYLKHLPVDTLKIDRSFVRDMAADPSDAAIVMAIITLAHSLKLRVVAEGVETEEQLRFLRLLRCDEMQGYLFSRPLPAEAFERLLSGTEPSAAQSVKTRPVSPKFKVQSSKARSDER
jgi:EAL domain-containing protein (putative c-di-GMP-specific phosphodiesterase class I)